MRIACHSPRSTHLQTGLDQGGDPVILEGLLAELRHRGHEVEIASRLNVRDVWRGKISVRRLVIEARSVRKRMRHFRPDAWLVYKPSRGHPDLFGWWQRPRRYVLLGAQWHQSKRMPRRWRPFLAWAHRQSLRRAHVITAERQKSFDRLLRHGVDHERLRLLSWAVPIWTAIPPQEDARRHLGLPLEAPIVLCATRFTGPKHELKTEMILDLLAVMPRLPADVLLVIAGDGPGRPRIEAEIQTLGLDERVRLVGAVERADLRWFFAACDVYAYPHRLDQPWTSVVEAQGCGRPVITMRTASGELTVDDGRSGLLAATLDEFADQLAALISDRSRCEDMGKAAGDYFAKFHSLEIRATQIEEFLSG